MRVTLPAMAPKTTSVIRGLAVSLLLSGAARAADPQSRSVIVEKPPAPTANLYRVSAQNTPSGFSVPRFVSLKFGKVNARTGPSRDHAIRYQYQRRGLPLVVVAETEMWRKVRDIHGDEAWVRKPALSGERRAILLSDTPLSSKADAKARTIARVQGGAVVELGECDAHYCRVVTDGGLKGWMPRHELWGAQSL